MPRAYRRVTQPRNLPPRVWGSAARRLFGKNGHPSDAGADYQCGFHADAGSHSPGPDAFAANPDAGVASVGGGMVDRPHLTRAEGCWNGRNDLPPPLDNLNPASDVRDKWRGVHSLSVGGSGENRGHLAIGKPDRRSEAWPKARPNPPSQKGARDERAT